MHDRLGEQQDRLRTFNSHDFENICCLIGCVPLEWSGSRSDQSGFIDPFDAVWSIWVIWDSDHTKGSCERFSMLPSHDAPLPSSCFYEARLHSTFSPVARSRKKTWKSENLTMSRKRKVVADEDEDPTKIEFETSEEVDVVPTFDQLKLREDLLRGVYAYGKCGVG